MNNTLVVTGASSGIGLAIAQDFLAQGWSVINLSRKPCPINTVHSLSVDLANDHWPDMHRATLLSALNNPDRICLVHNAAYHTADNIFTIDASTLKTAFQVNIHSAIQLNQLLNSYLKSDSSIIYISSTLGTKAIANAATYVTLKHATVGLMRASCQDLQQRRVHTCCICPGFTDTEMLRTHIGNDETTLNAIRARVGANRLINPKEIAALVYFAANNPVINGAVLDAHLGQIEI